jgi:tetratricopeptide (TPR) repeat protein
MLDSRVAVSRRVSLYDRMIGPNGRSLLEKAIELHKMGDLSRAIKTYESVLKESPQHPGAMNLLGLAWFQRGDGARAVPLLQKALVLRPDLPGAEFNLGTVLQALGRHEEAVPHFERALVLNPDDFGAHASLGNTLIVLGKRSEAALHYGKVVALRPDYAMGHVVLGNISLAASDFNKAASHYRTALKIEPKLLEAYFGLASALRGSGSHDDRIAVCRQAVAVAPDIAEVYAWYGGALHDSGRFSEAVEQHEKALALKPDLATVHFDLASSYYALNKYERACHHYRRAIDLGLPPEVAIKSELMIGWALQVLGRPDEADRIFDKIVAEHGDNEHGREAKKSKGMMYLNLGKFAEGWPLYDYRRGAEAPDIHEQIGAPWNGSALKEGSTLWVWSEQGLGDQILHAGMVDELRTLSPWTVLEVEPRLVDLFARSFPGMGVVPLDAQSIQRRVDAQTAIGNLGRHLRPSWQSFPKRVRGYLAADPSRTEELRSRLAGDQHKVMGLSWRSVSPQFGRHKSAKLVDFLQILRLPGVRFVDLQYGETAEERDAIKRETGIEIVRLKDIDNTNDIDGLAALVSACDVVVTVSNTTAHLAGALGVPTWVFVPYGFAHLWYWFAGKEQSPWYPRVTVKCQGEKQSWEELISASAPEIINQRNRVTTETT